LSLIRSKERDRERKWWGDWSESSRLNRSPSRENGSSKRHLNI